MSKRVRPSPLVPVVARHAIASVDPVGARALSRALADHVVSTTREGYSSAAKKYLRFCSDRNVEPYPAESLWVAAYIIDVVSSIKVQSLKVYLAAIQYTQVLEGYQWSLAGDELIRRARRFVKRRHPSPDKAPKFPVSLCALLRMVPHIAGWPNWDRICHDDLVFIAASVIAICGFLRGGEFLSYSGSARPVLKHQDVYFRSVGGRLAICIRISQPKNLWWIQFAAVTCFCPGPSFRLSPVVALRMYRRYSSVHLSDSGPAFVLSNGSALSRSFMVSRTAELLSAAGIALQSEAGAVAPVKAASWRAGGVRSALDANISGPMIMALGRWRSMAWESYMLQNTNDLQMSMQAMWNEGIRQDSVDSVPHRASVVGVLNPAAEFIHDDGDVRSEINARIVCRSSNQNAPIDSQSVTSVSRIAMG